MQEVFEFIGMKSIVSLALLSTVCTNRAYAQSTESTTFNPLKDQITNLKSDWFKQVKEWIATVGRSLIMSFWRHSVWRIKLTIE